MPSSHTDFQLPGLEGQPHALAGVMIAASFAYSRRHNRRCLEDHFYGFWNHILFALIGNLAPYVFISPQLTIQHSTSGRPNINMSIGTVADNDAEEKRPDFVLMGASIFYRLGPLLPDNLMLWHEIRIKDARPFVFVELKRPPPRGEPKKQRFWDALAFHMRDATEQADEQAALAFESSNILNQCKEIVLIAACGEWWKFKFAKKESYRPSSFFNDIDDEEDEKVEYRPGKKKQKAPAQPIRIQPLCRHIDNLDPRFVEYVCDDVDDATPPKNAWSRFIVFGTPESNQRLFLIHRELKRMRSEMGALRIENYESEGAEDEDELILHGTTHHRYDEDSVGDGEDSDDEEDDEEDYRRGNDSGDGEEAGGDEEL